MIVVLDSWAVLRYLEDADPAASAVAELLEGRAGATMSWMNLGEVFHVVHRVHGEDEAIGTIRDLRDRIDCRLPDEALVVAAARIKAEQPMAYADAFAAALAVELRATLWTGDPELLVADADWTWLDLR